MSHMVEEWCGAINLGDSLRRLQVHLSWIRLRCLLDVG